MSAFTPDLVSTYMPALEELTAEQIAGARARLVAYLQRGFPELDMRPGTPFGDLYITPAAVQTAALEVAMGRFMSDLDLENVANGIQYNCPFISVYLNGFSVRDQVNLQSSGTVLLTFTTAAGATGVHIDGSTQFSIGGASFRAWSPRGNDVWLRPGGYVSNGLSHDLPLVQISDERYQAAVFVVSDARPTTAISGGASVQVSNPPAGLEAAATAEDFYISPVTESLAALAAKARETFYAASVGNRGGAVQFVRREFPALTLVSGTITGDPEMARDQQSPTGAPVGCLDIWLRSAAARNETTIALRVPYNAVDQVFCGKLQLPSTPLRILRVTAAAAPDVALTVRVLGRTNDAAAPLAACAFSQHEDLWLDIPMPLDTDNTTELLEPLIDTAGKAYAVFNVTCCLEPMLAPVTGLLESPEAAPLGVKLLVRGATPLVIDALTITYGRAAGTQVDLSAARQEIARYINEEVGYPSRFTTARLIESMYHYGASDVFGITCSARVLFSCATHVMPYGAPDPTDDYAGAQAAAIKLPVPTVSQASALTPSYRDPLLGTADETFATCGFRTLAYSIAAANINFVETLE